MSINRLSARRTIPVCDRRAAIQCWRGPELVSAKVASFHNTSLVSGVDESPFADIAITNSSRGESGFERILERSRAKKQSYDEPSRTREQSAEVLLPGASQKAPTLTSPPAPDVDSRATAERTKSEGRLPDLSMGNAKGIQYIQIQEDTTNDMQKLHSALESEFQSLSRQTIEMLSKPSQNQSDILSALSQMNQWNEFLSSVTAGLTSTSDFRRTNPQYPPSQFMSNITYDSADIVNQLLFHILNGSSLLPNEEVRAYKLAMKAWSGVYHPQSGDNCEEVLERFGSKFGGDMVHMPTLDDYKTILRAHYMSTSSGFTFTRNKAFCPGEKAMGVSNFVSSLYAAGDNYLKPDVEFYSLVIASVRNTLLDWQGRRRLLEIKHEQLEKDLAVDLMDVLATLEDTLAEDLNSNSVDVMRWRDVIRSYADALAVLSNIDRGGNKSLAVSTLTKLEDLTSAHSDKISESLTQSSFDAAVHDGIKRHIEEAYYSSMTTGLNIARQSGYFSGFDASVSNARAAEDIFQRMNRRASVAGDPLFPSPAFRHYQALIQCWCECLRGRYSDDSSNEALVELDELPHVRAHRLLSELEKRHDDGQSVDGAIYSDLMWAWSQLSNWPGVYKQQKFMFSVDGIEDLLHRTMGRYEEGKVHFHDRNTVTKMFDMCFRYNSQLQPRSREDLMNRSLNLLGDMEGWYQSSGGKLAQPSDFTFALVLKSVANSGVESSSSIAQSLLTKMQDFGQQPTQRHYLAVMRAYSRLGPKGDVKEPQKVEEILRNVIEQYQNNNDVKPTTALYTACIAAYGGSRKYNSVSKVMELFLELQILYKETGDKDFMPDGQLYGVVIDAISQARSNDDASLRFAIKLLDEMETRHDAGELELGPNRFSYTNILRAISRMKEPDIDFAEDLVRRMEDRSERMDYNGVRPDSVTYTALIQVLSANGQSVDRAVGWLKEMERKHRAGNEACKPNRVTFTALINCWRRSGKPEAGKEAERLVERMEKEFEEGDLDMKPDDFVYASACDAWARSKSPDKAERTWGLYRRMKRHYRDGNLEAKPNNVVIGSIIKACGYTRGSEETKQRALKVLLQCMKELKTNKDLDASPMIYRVLLNAVKALVADDSKRRPITGTIFETACRDGKVDSSVLMALENAQPELYLKLPHEAQEKIIPSGWSRNITTAAN